MLAGLSLKKHGHWAGVACFAFALAWSGWSAARLAERKSANLMFVGYTDIGEVLRHGLRARADFVSYRMPLAALSASKLEYHTGARFGALLLIHVALAGSLILALALLLNRWGAFIAAAAIVILEGYRHNPDLHPDSGYYLLVLLAAGLIVWRARAPSLGSSALFAAAIGSSLLWRSSLAFLPPVVAFYEWIIERRFSLKGYRGQLLILCVVPYLFLAPWIAMNWAIHRRVVFFEKDAANLNIVIGAMGIVQNVEGDPLRVIEGQIDLKKGDSVVGWAAREILRHPIRYARAYVLRLKYALDPRPLVALLALWALWLYRKRSEYRALGLMTAYFLGIHCFMSVEERYFFPLWPLLTVLACSVPAVLGAREPPVAEGQTRLAGWALKVVLAAVVSLAFATQGTLLTFAGLVRGAAGSAEEQLSSAIFSNSDDPWLLSERAKERFNRGDFVGSAEDYVRAAELQPMDASLQLLRARAEALVGKPARLLGWRMPTVPRYQQLQLRIDADIMMACENLRAGRKSEALERLKVAQATFDERNIFARPAKDAHEEELRAKLRTRDNRFFAHCLSLQGPRPLTERLALLDALARLEPGLAEPWIERAELLSRADRTDEARKFLERARAMKPEPDQLQRIAAVYRRIQDYQRAAEVLGNLSRRAPDDLELLLDRAAALAQSGGRVAALEALAHAEARRPSEDQLRRVKEVYLFLMELERAGTVLDETARRFPTRAEPCLERAELAARLGQRGAALEALTRARERALDAEQLRRAQRLYSSLEDPRGAAAVLDERIRLAPRDPRLHLERSEAASRAGEKKEAVLSLDRARGLKRDAETSLRLAELYSELGESARAFELSTALAAARPGDARVLLLRGEAAARLGRRAEALEALARARPAAEGGDEELLRRVALAYQGLAEYDQALEIFTALTKRRPDGAVVFSDKALCEHLKGSAETALADLRTAIKLDPKFLPAYLTLGSIHAAAGRIDEAVKVYDQALVAAGTDPLREVLLSARRDALSRASR